MFTTAHLTFAFILLYILQYLLHLAAGLPSVPMILFLYYASATLIDGDIILPKIASYLISYRNIHKDSIIFKVFSVFSVSNHRLLPTHMPIYWLLFSPLILLGNPILSSILLGIYGHLFLDTIDYGLRLNPYNYKTYGLKLLKVEDGKSLSYYLRRYFKSIPILAIELGLGIFSLFLLLY